MNENQISYEIRGAIYNVYNTIDPGLLESVYQHLLTYELRKRGLNILCEVPLPVFYDNIKIDIGFRADMIVENKVIIELKSVEQILPVHHKQLLTYLKITGLKLEILVNFNTNDLKQSIFRKINGL